MRTASPWWLSLLFGVGLVSTLVGERLLSGVSGVHFFLSGVLGVGLLLLVTAARAWTTLSTSGSRRRVERTLLICHLGTLVGLALYTLTTSWGEQLLHIRSTDRWEGALTVLYGVLLLASIVPVLMVELSLGVALRTSFDRSAEADGGVEYMRVREIGWSGLSIAFAIALLMVTCQVSRERNIQRDLSYFKTSEAGESTRNIATASTEPIKVHLFFPPANEVKEQVKSYFEAMASATGKVEIFDHDRVTEADLATKYKVSKDGVIVLARGTGDKEKFFTIDVETDIQKARSGSSGSKLRNLDRDVNSNLMKLVREKRKAYVVTGHGEITNYDTVPADLKGKIEERRTTAFKKWIGDLNYESKDLGPIDLTKDVPDDATVVIMLAPTVPLLPAEWDTLGRYLDRGGKLMICLDPDGATSLGSLEGRLGVKLVPGYLTDDKEYVPQRGTLSDRRLVATTQFSAHPSTTALSRAARFFVPLIDAGALEDVPFTTKGAAPTKTVIIRSPETSWLDLDNNYGFDAGTEKRQKWTVGVAVEGPKDGGKDGFRALVFSDGDLFRDRLEQTGSGRLTVIPMSGPLLLDAVRWLGGEEVFSGEVVSEDDKPIQHTKNQDAYWFATMMIGAPLLVLTLGLVGTWARRRRSKKTEVTP